jgi:hypothetical protein
MELEVSEAEYLRSEITEILERTTAQRPFAPQDSLTTILLPPPSLEGGRPMRREPDIPH